MAVNGTVFQRYNQTMVSLSVKVIQGHRNWYQSLHKVAPEYLSTYCQSVSGISGRRHLRSADRGHLDFPRVKLAYAGPSNWNSLPAYLKDSSLSLSFFKHHLKTCLFSFY